jgi:hypothetical protein
MNLAFDIGESLPLDRQAAEIESELGDIWSDPQPQIETSIVPSLVEQPDIKTELELLLMSLQFTTPNRLNSALTLESSLIFDVAARSNDSEQKLSQYNQLIQSLSATVSADRLQLATMSLDLSNKLTDLDSLNTQITTTHNQIIASAATMRSRIIEIEKLFIELSTSVQAEKEQFYQLTVATIEKTEAIGSQLAKIVQQMSDDQDSIGMLKAEIQSVRYTVRQETEQKLNNLDLRYHQIISTWDDFQVRQKDRAITARKFSIWLWILSVAVGGIFVMLIRILTMLN